MKYLILALLLSSSLFSSTLGWSDDYASSLKVAQKEKKDLYLLITSSTCRWCKKFENTTLQDKEVLRLLGEKYILVHIDRDIDEFPSWMNTKSVPRHYFVSPKGEEIFTFVGYWDELDFRSFLKDVDKKKLAKNPNKDKTK